MGVCATKYDDDDDFRTNYDSKVDHVTQMPIEYDTADVCPPVIKAARHRHWDHLKDLLEIEQHDPNTTV